MAETKIAGLFLDPTVISGLTAITDGAPAVDYLFVWDAGTSTLKKILPNNLGLAAAAHTIESHDATSATGTNLETLTNAGDADALHTHALKAPLANPTFTGIPIAPTQAANNNSTRIATTAYVQTELTAYAADTVTLTNKTYDADATGNTLTNIEVANLKSGVLDTDLTSASGSDDTVASAKAIKTALDLKATLAGPTLTGTTTFATLSDGTIAVTAWVDQDDMSSNSDTLIPTQQSVKAYVDATSGIAWQGVVTGTTLSALPGKGYPIDTSSNACTVTLPASPSVGDTIQFVDYARNFSTNSLTLALNSLKFQGGTSNAAYALDGQSVTIVYVDTPTGWIPTNDVAVARKAPILMKFLVVGGGGGAGGNSAGGGGAGGFRTGSGLVVTSGATYNIVIGAGGNANGNNNGVDTTFAGSGITTITAVGGGYGATSSPGAEPGGDGGSGGGGQSGGGAGGDGIYDAGETLGTALHQGRDGGTAPAPGGTYPGGGGGGASAVGVDPASNTAAGGNGGAGEDQVMGLSASDSMTFMTAVSAGVVSSGARYFAGGGGGANGGTGGVGGGGNGATSGTAGSGVANTGGGGGGASGTGGAGGSGIVILAVLTSDYSGTSVGSSAIETSGSYTLIKFTSNGSYTA